MDHHPAKADVKELVQARRPRPARILADDA
jgi:hypothetical protein